RVLYRSRIERVRIEPDRPQPLPNLLAAQVLQVDAEAGPIGELAVVAALAGEVGEHLDRVAHVADQDKRRPDVIVGERARILLRLLAGVAHQHVPAAMRAASAADGRGVEPGSASCAALSATSFLPPFCRLCLASRTKQPRRYGRSGRARSCPPRRGK